MAVHTYRELHGHYSGCSHYITLIQLPTQPPFKCTLTGWGSGCTLTIRAAYCTLTIGATMCTPMVGVDGCTIMVGAAKHGLVGAGGVLGLCPHGLCYALAVQ